MSNTPANVLIGQSGGPTAVINQSLVGIVETARADPRVAHVLGSLHGIQGVLRDEIVDLTRESRRTLEGVARTPGSALRSVRKKPTREECEQVIARLVALNVRWFFYIGGNDSAETAHLLDGMAREARRPLSIVHVPKTIDNDLRETDHCPGYGSAARFVACALAGDDEDNRSLPGIKIDVIMGRHAGWLTAASVLARTRPDDGPHLIYVPERTFTLDSFASDVERVHARLGRCVVALSEGVHGADGKPIVELGERDSHGNVQLSGSGALGDFLVASIKERLSPKLRVRADTFGYLQRSFGACGSPVDAREARAVGRFAARTALSDAGSTSISLVRAVRDGAYAVEYVRTELPKVAKSTRVLDERFITGDHDIAPAFLEYVAPLVGRLPKRARLSDHPFKAR